MTLVTIIWVSNNDKENDSKINNSMDKNFAWTPSVNDKQQAKDLTTNTNFTTISKNSAGNCPNMRIKRSSSKKNRSEKPQLISSADTELDGKNKPLRMTHSNDSRDKSIPGFSNLKESVSWAIITIFDLFLKHLNNSFLMLDEHQK